MAEYLVKARQILTFACTQTESVMANTFSQIHLHIVFAVKYRDAMLDYLWRNDLFRYIGGVIKNYGHIPVAIGGFIDHIHILIGCKPTINIPNLVKDIKLAANQWVQPKYKCKFGWQDGYAVFSISKTHVEALTDYIRRQDDHHRTESMVEEFKRFLSINGVGYDERYVFHEPE